MPHKLPPGVLVSFSAPGAAAFSGATARAGWRTLAQALVANDTTEYRAVAVDATTLEPQGDWEYGIGRFDGTAMERTPLASTNAGAAVNFTGTVLFMIAEARLDRSALEWFESDCWYPLTGSLDPFAWVAVSSGTLITPSTTTGRADHPGVVELKSSTTANSGGRVDTDAAAFLIQGGELFRATLRPLVFTATTLRAGFRDNTTSTDVVDGAYIEVSTSGVATGKTASNSTRSSTSTTYTLTAGTWYTFDVDVVSTALVRYSIRDDSDNVLWTDTLAANIPSVSGRETGAGVIVTNSGTTATSLLQIDRMGFGWNRKLARPHHG